MQFDLSFDAVPAADVSTDDGAMQARRTPVEAALQVASELDAALQEIQAAQLTLQGQMASRDAAIAGSGVGQASTQKIPAMAALAGTLQSSAVEVVTRVATATIKVMLVELAKSSGVQGPGVLPALNKIEQEIHAEFAAGVEQGLSVPDAMRLAIGSAVSLVSPSSLSTGRAQFVREKLANALSKMVSRDQYEPGAEVVRTRGKIVWTLWTHVEDGFRDRALSYDSSGKVRDLIDAIEYAVALQQGASDAMGSSGLLFRGRSWCMPFEPKLRWELAHGIELVARLKGYQLLLPDEVAAAIAMTLAE